MAERGGRRDDSGTSGGTDVEPLRGGMREVERGSVGPGPATAEDPPAPYHGVTVPEGGAAPRGEPAGSTPREGTPPDPGEAGESAERTAGKLHEERRDYEREGGNAPRR